ncbi:MAG TPA: SusC/RagA family TonB-linked outer membrane protein, partial [Bacteroidales bacterium]|nr:SusC/RagA family TonB-linked outer membrane protein [Bacteroidales bacterium]
MRVKKIKKHWIIILLLGLTGYVNGQTTLTGRVTSSIDNTPLPGVSITIKGTTAGTVTDTEGNYTLSVQPANVLIFSYVGFLPEEITVGTERTINVALNPDIKTLEQVVVMGYSTRKRSEITSAVTTVSSEKLQGVTSNNIETMLQGKVAGISVVDNSGAPGSRPDVRVRGVASMSAPQGPLYVVDGIIGGNFDPNDVETITVLKDAGATGMYGSQANGGVIVVTTKRAKSDVPHVEFKAVYGRREADHGNVKMMDSKTLYQYQRELYRDPTYFQVDDRKFRQALPDTVLKTNTNWLEECFKPAAIQNYYLSASGRSQKFKYYVGGSYYDEEGTFIHTYFKRINLRANTSYNLTKKITLINNISLGGSKDRQADYMNLYYAYVSMPWDSPYDKDGNVRSFKTANNIWSKDKINPVQAAENSEFSSRSFSMDYDASVNIDFTNWLSFTSTNRLSTYYSTSKTYYAKKADNLSYTGTGYIY